MLHPYITMEDKTEVTFSDITEESGSEILTVYFERPIKSGFVSAECSLPDYTWKIDGLKVDEITSLQRFVEENCKSFFKFARQGGISVYA